VPIVPKQRNAFWTGGGVRPVYDPIDYLQPGCTSLRGILRDCETAVRRGQLAGPENAVRRARLMKAVTDLEAAPGLSSRVYVRVAKIIALMAQQDLSQTEPA
jgi:hypothetical protein